MPSSKIPSEPKLATSKERPFVCRHCPNRFLRAEHLKRHERLHTGLQPYKCEFCPSCFTRGDMLLRHERKHHAKDKPPQVAKPRSKSSGSATRPASASVALAEIRAEQQALNGQHGRPGGLAGRSNSMSVYEGSHLPSSLMAASPVEGGLMTQQDYESALRLTTSPSSAESPASVAASVPANMGTNYTNFAMNIGTSSAFGYDEEGHFNNPLMTASPGAIAGESLLSQNQQQHAMFNMMQQPFTTDDYTPYQLQHQMMQQQDPLQAQTLHHHASNSSLHTVESTTTAPSNLYLANPAMQLQQDNRASASSPAGMQYDMLSSSFPTPTYSHLSSGFMMPSHPLRHVHHERANSMIVDGVDMHPSHLLMNQYKQTGLDFDEDGVIVEDDDEEGDDLNTFAGVGLSSGSALFAGVPNILDSAFAFNSDLAYTESSNPDVDEDAKSSASAPNGNHGRPASQRASVSDRGESPSS
ncbi:hypothetical protein BCR37DRAFT_241820 [Protomyces lactucae-debilis]|uniref:C2H2-type domain-containing protein n=1 Tax=Protomyces lactucae-debilis TaxID=2754530 RepID=A0A1Y2FNG5_PROLT|nr:uncharacterized protein BCR37DRAFT_241820 [Protomyces lactucae-debilis]ORY85550.1 hypothetical protein BCR37DRAFT_241820 [Protomyces lactucae-debilis]